MEFNQYEVIDLKFKADFDIDPFCELEFYAEIYENNIKYKRVEGFYNSDNEFIIRLNFNKSGQYNYKTYSNIAELSNKEDEILIKASNRLKGPICLSKEVKNRLFYEDGASYNLLAFECDWLFAIGYKEEGDKLERLIKYFSDNRINQIIMNVYAKDLRWGGEGWESGEGILPEDKQGDREDIFPFKGSNSEPDFSALNVDFFKHLDKIINLLNEYNIVSHLMIYVWNKKVNWPGAYSKADNMYFDYVVKRYQGYPNILWDVSKEALGYGGCDANFLLERILRLKRLDSYGRLLTMHDYGFCNKYSDLVDIISVQNWKTDINYVTNVITNKYKNKPVLNLEHGGYEKGPYSVFNGNYNDAKICLRRNYEIMFAGAYSAYYWQPLSWSVTLMPWASDPEPHFEYYKHLGDFFEKYDYSQFTMKEGFPFHINGGFSLMNASKDTLLTYLPKEHCALGINTVRHSNSGQYRFFNTITGEYTSKQKIEFIKFNRFFNPFNEDCILILEFDL